MRDGYIPTRPPMSDLELAQKLNLDLPQLEQVKAALGKKDATALQAALGVYLNSRLAPAQVTATGQPAANAAEANKWLAPEITFANPYVDRPARVYPLGEHINWFLGWTECEGGRISDWYFAPPLAEAYRSSGDPRYAQRLLTFARDFYQTGGRPPAQRPTTWLGCGGPWRSQGHMQGGVELFPGREDFAYVVSAGKQGKLPTRTARDFWNSGLAMMGGGIRSKDNRLAEQARHSSAPTGLCPKAQGCEARATLGHRPPNIPNRNAVAANPFPQVRTTLGWKPQSFWDC